MSDPEDAIRSRLRRSRDAIQAVSDAVAGDGHDAVPDLVPDAVARALDALYDLAEVVKKQGGHSLKNLDDLVDGDAAGETTLGLLCARGAKTHALVDFGDLHTFGSHRFGEGPFGGGWAWQEFEDPRFSLRSTWYASHVQGRLVLDPLEVALAWLANRPELSTG